MQRRTQSGVRHCWQTTGYCTDDWVSACPGVAPEPRVCFFFLFPEQPQLWAETCSDWIRRVVAGAAETPSHTSPQVALLLFKPLVQNKMWRTISADTMVPTHADNNGVDLYSVLAASYWCPLHCKREKGEVGAQLYTRKAQLACRVDLPHCLIGRNRADIWKSRAF